jgi:hypothetical protein
MEKFFINLKKGASEIRMFDLQAVAIQSNVFIRRPSDWPHPKIGAKV